MLIFQENIKNITHCQLHQDKPNKITKNCSNKIYLKGLYLLPYTFNLMKTKFSIFLDKNFKFHTDNCIAEFIVNFNYNNRRKVKTGELDQFNNSTIIELLDLGFKQLLFPKDMQCFYDFQGHKILLPE